MAISRQEDPRANQKERTRAAIVDAALELMKDGSTPTVAAAAEAARVSRATAYRYFPTQDALVTELLTVIPTTSMVDTLESFTSPDPEERLLGLLDTFNPIVLEEEPRYRAALRIYLDTWLASNAAQEEDPPRVRVGRRMRWLDQVLEPLHGKLSDAEWTRLRHALSLTLGIDSVVILKDACGIEDDAEILATLRWSAHAMLTTALREAESSPDAASA